MKKNLFTYFFKTLFNQVDLSEIETCCVKRMFQQINETSRGYYIMLQMMGDEY